MRAAYRPTDKEPEDFRARRASDMVGYQEITCHIVFDVKWTLPTRPVSW